MGLVVLFCVFILHQFPSDFMGALENQCQAYNKLLYSRDELFVWQKQLIYNTQSTKNVLFKFATTLNGKKKCQRTIWYKLQGKKPNTYSQGEVIDYFFFFFLNPWNLNRRNMFSFSSPFSDSEYRSWHIPNYIIICSAQSLVCRLLQTAHYILFKQSQ